MTKEELKKEARKDVDSLNGVDLVSSTMVAIDKYGAYKIGRYDGYLAGAEPREKKIAELERKLEQTEKDLTDYQFNYPKIKDLEKENAELKKVAEVGYNKANEWHYVKDGDLPEIDNRIVLCVCSNGYINGKRNHILKLLTRKEFPLFQPVYAWKEIVLPKENE